MRSSLKNTQNVLKHPCILRSQLSFWKRTGPWRPKCCCTSTATHQHQTKMRSACPTTHQHRNPALTIHSILQQVFGYEEFIGPQQAIIEHVVAGGDALVLMPTGGGKSLCYQIPAIARERAGQGVTVVVSPLIALMHDQVGALHEAGVNAAFLNSSQSPEDAGQIERRFLRGDITLLYAAPERVTTAGFLARLDSLRERGLLSLFAIDEAHCVSQWGHDFRPEYRALTVLHERYSSVPRMALTATADALTRVDILERLQLQDARQFVSSCDRPNIRYTIVEKADATGQVLRFIGTEHPGESGIVYCQSRRRVDDVARFLCEQGIAALPYHAGLDAEVRQFNQNQFLAAEGMVMVATIAFGMGIDKPDVRFVAHLDMPKNIEGYYQETGRAGRDGKPADAWMCYGLNDVVNQRRMIEESVAAEEHKRALRGKLDTLLGLAEATDCRRVRLLQYFGEASQPCGNCDNCLSAPAVWDGTDAARMLLSTVYRIKQFNGMGFGSGHIIDVVRGKPTDKVEQHGHRGLSTFGVGAAYSERQMRGVLRQLIGIGALTIEVQDFNTLALADPARAILKGEVAIKLRQSASRPTARPSGSVGNASIRAALQLDKPGHERFAALKSWRAHVAREHNLPAYVIFHDATLEAIAQRCPRSLDDLQGISGMGVKKMQTYGEDVLRVLADL